MQDELRIALGEYQERVRSRVVGGAVGVEGNVTSGAEGKEGNAADVEREQDGTRAAALLDHTRPHVPSTDPLPFPALPDSGSRSSAASTAPTLLDKGAATLDVSANETAEISPAETTEASSAATSEPPPAPTDAESQPIHPAIIIGLRSITRDPTEETSPVEHENGDRSVESGDRVRVSESMESVFVHGIGGYGWVKKTRGGREMLNEFLGQVKPPTATREDIAKAGLRIVKGVDVKELAASGSVAESCTERCLICLEDYADEEDLRIMNCKHMFHKDCVDRWMETGRNNCPACRTKGVEVIPTSPSESSSTSIS
ncbi:hypothetical protein FRC11_008828 [Ceratobasidium sp. 423]|nr:hypothetical protein FRC11_008828 [Ceratobasidium sp. 423]